MSDHSHDEFDDHGARLEALEERIQRLEAALQASTGASTREFVDSGSIHPELDDQGIAP